MACSAGVLSGGAEEFETTEDVYNAVGDILAEIDGGETSCDEAVQQICQRLLAVVKRCHWFMVFLSRLSSTEIIIRMFYIRCLSSSILFLSRLFCCSLYAYTLL